MILGNVTGKRVLSFILFPAEFTIKSRLRGKMYRLQVSLASSHVSTCFPADWTHHRPILISCEVDSGQLIKTPLPIHSHSYQQEKSKYLTWFPNMLPVLGFKVMNMNALIFHDDSWICQLFGHSAFLDVRYLRYRVTIASDCQLPRRFLSMKG